MLRHLFRAIGVNEADLNLVAAAPELLEALREALCWIPDGSRQTPDQRGAKCETAYDARKMVRAILSKAEGGAA